MTPEPTLRGVDLEVPAGTKLALVGETGSGKTTVGYLAARLYDPERGRLTLDGAGVAHAPVSADANGNRRAPVGTGIDTADDRRGREWHARRQRVLYLGCGSRLDGDRRPVGAEPQTVRALYAFLKHRYAR